MEEQKNYVPLVIDIESSSLLENMIDFSSLPYKLKEDAKLWWVVIRNTITGEIKKAAKEEITKEWMEQSLEGCTHLIAHNGIKFDFLVLKLFGVLDYKIGYLNEPDEIFGKPVQVVDTLILSRLTNPDRFGGHSLESWGERIGQNKKIDFRKASIEQGLIDKNSPKGAEFEVFSELMGIYCEGDTAVNVDTYNALLNELQGNDWSRAIKVENKLADLAIRRESFGFWFDKDLAVKCVEDLTQKMEELQNKVNPILPPKPMTKTELFSFTPPATQFLKSGKPSTHIIKFAERIGGQIVEKEEKYFIEFENNYFELPFNGAVKSTTEADISNLDHVKSTLIDVYGWEPSEWAERDFTKDSKKQSLSYDKRKTAFERWLKETEEGKYKKLRLKIAFENFKVRNVEKLLEKVLDKLKEDFPVRLPTSPKVRVGVMKELCPNLIKLGEKVGFANDFALFLTYKHRKASIAGGEIEDMDFDNEAPNSGFLSMYREIDGRIPTPAIEIGASSNRYRHIGVTNVARASSVYGKEMRSLFGAGKDGVQFGYDFSSIEARIQSSYCWKYTNGIELSKALLSEKPHDIHTLTGQKLGLDRDSAKSINYMLLYGGKVGKIVKMLSCSQERAKEIFDGFWDSVQALKELKIAVEKYWDENKQTHVPALDGRLIKTRSRHSLLNSIFQSGAVICAKYVNVLSMQYLQQKGYKIDVFESQPEVANMIEYHDECQLFVKPNLLEFKTFTSKQDAQEYIKNWEGGQLSSIGNGKTWYVCLPNIISEAIEYGIKETEKILKLNVPLGYEWTTGRTWFDCH